MLTRQPALQRPTSKGRTACVARASNDISRRLLLGSSGLLAGQLMLSPAGGECSAAAAVCGGKQGVALRKMQA